MGRRADTSLFTRLDDWAEGGTIPLLTGLHEKRKRLPPPPLTELRDRCGGGGNFPFLTGLSECNFLPRGLQREKLMW